MKTLDFILNGEACHTEIPEDATLLKVLRDILHLTGTKEGCGEGYRRPLWIMVRFNAVSVLRA